MHSASLLLLLVLPLLMIGAAPAAEPGIPKEQASAFAKLALKGLTKEYPNHPGHALGGP